MIYLKKFVELLNDQKRDFLFGHINKENVYNGIEKAKVFVVQGHDDLKGISEIPEVDPSFSLPFEVCWFEVFDGGLATWEEEARNRLYIIRGVLIEEVAPGCFNYGVFFEAFSKRDGVSTEHILTIHDGLEMKGIMGEIHRITKNAVHYIINRINRTDVVGLSSTSERLKLKTSKGKLFHKVRKIINIVPKKDRDSISTNRDIEWSHRWLVRGHWRKHSGLGKNRSGEYCVKDFTWVNDHEKGPDDAPLVADKTRVLKL